MPRKIERAQEVALTPEARESLLAAMRRAFLEACAAEECTCVTTDEHERNLEKAREAGISISKEC